MKQPELGPKDIAQKLGVGLDHVYSLLWSGKLPGRKVDGRWRVHASDVDARLKSKEARRGTTTGR
jgi:excisionase family DNA binding protein